MKLFNFCNLKRDILIIESFGMPINIKSSIEKVKILLANRLTIIVRIFSIVSAILYVVFLYDVAFPWYAYTVELFVKAFFGYLVYGILGNFGLFLITTKVAKNFRLLSTIFYIPTLIITPLVVGNFLRHYSTIFVFFLSIIIYYKFNPWRKSE